LIPALLHHSRKEVEHEGEVMGSRMMQIMIKLVIIQEGLIRLENEEMKVCGAGNCFPTISIL
jgi:hypothetical protein